ncbi:hypothetical protein GCM10011506_34170 [Marivirga lumbricoides]|uniref:DKNYY family protein n=1 Tax=Marivirga lumbricoides TaxID=1046115 RepID=A0ABQ1MS39_9BACT|nr:hypothetical protein GCM10011506_34170 [Marivirga lumbricoides]
MKLLSPNSGIFEAENIYQSCLVTHAYLENGTEKTYYFMFEYIPELNLFSTYLTQGKWTYYNGEIFNAETKNVIDFGKESTFQNYTYVEGQLVNCEKLSPVGKLKLNKTTEHLYLVHQGEYDCYFYSTASNSSFPFKCHYLLLDNGRMDIPVYRVLEKDEFYYFQLTPKHLICWKQTDSIDNYFSIDDAWQDLSVAYRKHKISQITA